MSGPVAMLVTTLLRYNEQCEDRPQISDDLIGLLAASVIGTKGNDPDTAYYARVQPLIEAQVMADHAVIGSDSSRGGYRWDLHAGEIDFMKKQVY